MSEFSGEYLRKLRQAKGLTQIQLSEETKKTRYVDPRTICHWENWGNPNPRRQNLAAVAQALGANIEDFYVQTETEIAEEMCTVKIPSAIFLKYEKYCMKAFNVSGEKALEKYIESVVSNL